MKTMVPNPLKTFLALVLLGLFIWFLYPQRQVFRNEQFRFTFEYPSIYAPEDAAIENWLTPRPNHVFDIRYFYKEPIPGNVKSGRFVWFSGQPTRENTVDVSAYDYAGAQGCDPNNKLFHKIKVLSDERISVAGVQAHRVTTTSCYHFDRHDTWLLFVRDGVLFEFLSGYGSEPSLTAKNEPIELFLRTFRFETLRR